MSRAAILDQSAQPVKNLSNCPAFAVDVTSAQFSNLGTGQASLSSVTYDSVDRPLSWGRSRVEAVNGTGQLGRRWVTTTLHSQVKPGDVVRYSIWVKANTSLKLSPTVEYCDDASVYIGGQGNNFTVSTTGGTISGFSVILPVNQWVKITWQCTVPATVGAGNVPRRLLDVGYLTNSGIQSVAGDVVKYGPSVITVNTPLDTYVDGDTPGWRWLGTTGLSQSVGMPYTLEGIAGKPLYFAENVAPGLISNLTVPLIPFTVASTQQCDVTFANASGGFWDIQPGGSAQSGRRMLASTAGSSYRGDTGRQAGGVAAKSYTLSCLTMRTMVCRAYDIGNSWLFDGVPQTPENWPAQAIPVFSVSALSNLKLRIGGRDGAQQAGTVVTPGIAIWSSLLSDETSKRVTGWLARKYGTPIPAGY